jgi:hypothetical protein
MVKCLPQQLKYDGEKYPAQYHVVMTDGQPQPQWNSIELTLANPVGYAI